MPVVHKIYRHSQDILTQVFAVLHSLLSLSHSSGSVMPCISSQLHSSVVLHRFLNPFLGQDWIVTSWCNEFTNKVVVKEKISVTNSPQKDLAIEALFSTLSTPNSAVEKSSI